MEDIWNVNKFYSDCCVFPGRFPVYFCVSNPTLLAGLWLIVSVLITSYLSRPFVQPSFHHVRPTSRIFRWQVRAANEKNKLWCVCLLNVIWWLLRDNYHLKYDNTKHLCVNYFIEIIELVYSRAYVVVARSSVCTWVGCSGALRGKFQYTCFVGSSSSSIHFRQSSFLTDKKTCFFVVGT